MNIDSKSDILALSPLIDTESCSARGYFSLCFLYDVAAYWALALHCTRSPETLDLVSQL